MAELAQAFALRGAETDLVVMRASGPYLSLLPPNVRVIDLRASRAAVAVPALARYLRRNKPFTLLSTLTHANVAAVAASVISQARTRVFVREANYLSVAARHDTTFRRRLLPLVARWLYPRSSSVIAVSNAVADDLSSCGIPRERIRVIHNPVPCAELRRLATEPLADPWFAPGMPPVILAVGRLSPQKDYPNLLRAFALLRRQHDCRLLILGEGEERPTLQRLVEELGITADVRMPGFAENPFPFMANAAMLVLASAWEGLPNVLLQACVLGCPVVSTDCPGGSREILEGGRLGALVPVGDSSALADALAHTLAAPVDRAALRARGEAFDTSVIAQQYWDLLHE
jgi:glycosyltransferase involved in cell wall biosynthesis